MSNRSFVSVAHATAEGPAPADPRSPAGHAASGARRPLAAVLACSLGLAAALALAAPPAPAAAQTSPSPALQEAYFAWDAGDYIAAMESYLQVLQGPDGRRYAEEVALLTGERHPVREVDEDGRNGHISPDGRHLAWERQLESGWVTRIEPVEGSGSRIEIPARNVALSAAGHAAWVEEGGDEAPDRLRLRDLSSGEERTLEVAGLEPLSAVFAPDAAQLFVVARSGEDGPRRIARLAAPDWSAELLELGEGEATSPLPVAGGRHLVFTRPGQQGQGGPRIGLADLETGQTSLFEGSSPSVAAGGSTLAFFERDGDDTRLVAVPLSGAGGGVGASPRTLLETDLRISNPAVSPDGRRVAYQLMVHTDWEVFLVDTDGSGEELRVTREIQHDLFPAWVTDDLLLAMKGESRHRRAHLYDVSVVGPGRTADGYELFHNNTLRTIAPQYGWIAHPQGRGVLINAERDGNTISPERAMYWVDLTRTVGHDEVVERVRSNLEAERDLQESGRAAFAPLADEIRPVADAVSVGRVHHYANALYQFGSKFATQPGNPHAIEYLRETLESWGYDVELQWFEASGRGGGARTANVVATLPGTEHPELVYIISSHFDSVLRAPGADDNSSGTTALLEAARVLAEHPRRATIKFAFLTAEEAGLLGAREFVRRAQEEGMQVAGVLNNDMIGWTRSHRLDNTIRYSNDGIRDLQHAAATQFSDLITYDSRYYRGTDAAVFFQAYGDIVGGIGSYPVLGNPNYHQATDQLETINHQLVAEVSRTTVATIMLLADGPSRVSGLRLAEPVDNGMVFEWDAAPERAVREYRVRVRGSDGEWRELDPVQTPRVQLDPGLDVEEIAVRARFPNGLESFDDARLERADW